jgi:putative phosphoribosyl transferase
MARFRFADRHDAGRALAAALTRFAHRPDVVVLGLPRGGIVVAAEVAVRLGAPLDVVVVRKLGAPGRAELAMGALAVWGARTRCVRNEHVTRRFGVSDRDFDAVRARELELARHRAEQWSQSTPAVAGRTVILVDDGLATGATLRAAIEVMRDAAVGRLVVGLPVGPAQELAGIGQLVDEVECVHAPEDFGAVAVHYADFGQVDDDTVGTALAQAAARVS